MLNARRVVGPQSDAGRRRPPCAALVSTAHLPSARLNDQEPSVRRSARVQPTGALPPRPAIGNCIHGRRPFRAACAVDLATVFMPPLLCGLSIFGRFQLIAPALPARRKPVAPSRRPGRGELTLESTISSP